MTKEQASNSIYEYFENELDLSIAYAQKEITVEPIDASISESMDLHDDPYVVIVRGLVYLENTECFGNTLNRSTASTNSAS